MHPTHSTHTTAGNIALQQQEALAPTPYPWKWKGRLPVSEDYSRRRLSGPTSPLSNCKGQLAKNHVKKCRKESSSGEGESDWSRAAGRNPRINRRDPVASCYRGNYRTTRPALPGQPPSQQPSRHLQALSLQPSRGVVPRKRQSRQYLPGTLPQKPGKLHNTHWQRAGGLESSLDPRVCPSDANPGRVVFPQKEEYFRYSRCSPIGNPSFQTSYTLPASNLARGGISRVPKAKQNSSNHDTTTSYSQPSVK